jgi:hypothetical protein
MDVTEFNAMLREHLGVEGEPTVETGESVVEKVVEKVEPVVEKIEPAKVVEKVEQTDLQKALATIANLETKVAGLESRGTTTERRAAEPSVESVEVLPGVHLPKDRSKWPIKLGREDLLRLKWNEDPAEAMNVLANAFYSFVLDTIPTVSQELIAGSRRAEEAATGRVSSFFGLFPDLKGFDDLLEVVERGARKEGIATRFQGEDYSREVGKRTRTQIAKLRGITLEQYESALTAQNKGGARTTSRAVSPSGGVRPTTPRATESEKEFNDMLER